MKDNKTDNLFRNKLRNLEKPPGPNAWGKINDQLQKTENTLKILWWQKAAVFLILCLSGYLFYKTGDINNTQTDSITELKDENVQDQNLTLKEKTAVDKNNPNESKPKYAQSDSLSLKSTIPVEPKIDNYITKIENDKINKNPTEMPGVDKYLDHQEYSESIVRTNSSPIEKDFLSSTKGEVVAQKRNAPPPITIEFKSGKKTPEKSMVADTHQDKLADDQSFSLKKLLAKVKDVKEGEIGLAELRQAKDDLFAFDTFKENNKASEK